ncbi:MAG TPA: hypothetical protein VFL80_00465 [Thermoanaerobaculia bacterium]|nr:hypothetical protein [Thermoanaerobaculia bacterium]
MTWPHAPLHSFTSNGIYFVTGATYLKQHFYRDCASLDRLQNCLFLLAEKHECALQAWSFFSNHYHLVADGDGKKLQRLLSELHSIEGHRCNERDGTPGRRVWYQFRETELTYERSWMARLRYTHENAVHHGLVAEATNYRWCSANWFANTARRSFVESVRQFKIDRLNVRDDFDVVMGQ